MKNSSNSTLNSSQNLENLQSVSISVENFSPVCKKSKSYSSISKLNPQSLPCINKPPRIEFLKKSLSNTQSVVFDELSSLQTQIKEINSRIEKNYQIIREKETRNKQLKEIIEQIETKTIPTDISFEESKFKWACSEKCSLF